MNSALFFFPFLPLHKIEIIKTFHKFLSTKGLSGAQMAKSRM